MSWKFWKKKKHQTEADAFMDVDNARNLRSRGGHTHYVLWAAAAVMLIAILWASLAQIDEVTSGEGKIIPSSKIQVIQHLEGGIVEKILVKEGEHVKKGDILMEIDDVHYGALYREGLLKTAALKAKIIRLEAEANDAPFTVPKELAKQNPKAVKNERQLYEANKRTLDSKLNTLAQQAKQRRQEMAVTKAKTDRLGRSHALVEEELKMTRPLLKSGAASRVEVLRLERQVNDIAGELNETKLSIQRSKDALAEAESKIEELKAIVRSKAAQELSEMRTLLASQEETNQGLRDRASRTILKSPVNGIIKIIHVGTIGGTVKPGMDLIEIVPSEATLLVEAKIRPADVAFLHPGQPASVKLTAYDFIIYGDLDGTLEHISADTVTDPKGNSYYVIRVRTNKNYLGSKENPLPIIPGMVAEVSIITGKKTVLSYILKPLLRGQQRALRER